MPVEFELAEGDRVGADIRFAEPLYTHKDLGFYLSRPRNTIRDWAGYRGSPVITSLPSDQRNEAEVPFVGLAEAIVVQSFRKAGASMQYVRKALDILRNEMELEHAFASGRLYTHGAQILYNHAESGFEKELAEIVTNNRVFTPVVEGHLKLIRHGDDEWPSKVIIPLTKRPILEADYLRAFGQPLFIRGGARLEDVLDRLAADDEEDFAHVCLDFGVHEADVLDILRALARERAA